MEFFLQNILSVEKNDKYNSNAVKMTFEALSKIYNIETASSRVILLCAREE